MAVRFALEDGAGGVLGTDGFWYTAQIVEALGAKPRFWPSAADALRFSEVHLGRRCVAIPVDTIGRATGEQVRAGVFERVL